MMKGINQLKILRVYFILALIESAFVLFLLIRTPSEAKNAVVFGFSWYRLGLASFLGLAALSFLFLLIGTWKQSTSKKLLSCIDKWLSRRSVVHTLLIGALFVILFGTITLLYSNISLGGPIYYFVLRLVPLVWWLIILSLLTMITLLLLRGERRLAFIPALVILLAIVLSGMSIHMRFSELADPEDEDIYYVFIEGQRLRNGENPYERVLSGDMRANQKYATYFPVFYYWSWGMQEIGLHRFKQWLDFFQIIFLFANLFIAVLLFYVPYRDNLLVLAVFGSLFWLFNRWTLSVSMGVDLDFLPILFLLLSLILFPRHKGLSFLMFGLSLGIKQMAIFLIPLYLIWVWQESDRHPIRQVVIAGFFIAIIPVIASLPFIIWNWEGFYKSILFSATRYPHATFGAVSVDALLGWIGIPAKIPMLFLTFLIYILAWQRRTKPYTAVLLVMAIFIHFNSILFKSYMLWVVPFIPLAAYELALAMKKGTRARIL